MLKKLSVAILAPIALYDVLTSVIGGFALFSIDDWSEANPLILGFPFVLALGAVVLNFWTFPVWEQTEGSARLLRVPWFLFIGYDFYTTLLGVAGIIDGGSVLSLRFRSISDIASNLDGEKVLVGVVLAAIIVVTPMTCNLILRLRSD